MRTISIFIVSVLIMLAASCSTDDSSTGNVPGSDKVNVKICLATGGSASRSANNLTAAWDDKNAVAGEMMRNCFVVITQNGIIRNIITSEDYPTEQSYVGTLSARIDKGETTFYSFANLRPQDIGLDPDIDYSASPTPLPDNFDDKLYTAFGNAKDIEDFPNGIPMSNKQTVTITERTQEVDLEVIRMVAKVKLLISNDTSDDITVRSISLSDITANEEDNIYLLPGKDNGTSVEPHINASASKETRIVTLDSTLKIKANSTEPKSVTFYINESVASTPGYFVISIDTDQPTSLHRVAMMKWNTISRNDFLLVPIKLNDYRITFDVEQFTAIGVLPSVENNNDMLTVRFRSYGEFHIIPHVVRLSDGKELTGGTDATDGWTFNGWSLLEMSPSGSAGTCIYDRMPAPEQSRHSIEGYIGNRNGYALHQILIHIHGMDYDIPCKVQVIKE